VFATQVVHAPLVPQAVCAVPGAHVPLSQQPPLHGRVDEHVVVHMPVVVSQASPIGHWPELRHPASTFASGPASCPPSAAASCPPSSREELASVPASWPGDLKPLSPQAATIVTAASRPPEVRDAIHCRRILCAASRSRRRMTTERKYTQVVQESKATQTPTCSVDASRPTHPTSAGSATRTERWRRWPGVLAALLERFSRLPRRHRLRERSGVLPL
jgi:hypothetical protein